MRRAFVILLFPFAVLAQNELTVEQAIEIGLKNNYDIQIARKNAEVSENTSRLGTSGFLPTLDATGSYTLSRSDQETNSPFSFGTSTTSGYSGQVALNWTLFDGFKMFVDSDRYNELEKLGVFQARNIIENSVVGIVRAYFNLVQQEQLLDVAENTRDISETRLNKAKVRNEVGGASSTDVLNAQVSLNNDIASVLTQELNVEIARKELNILLGNDPDAEIKVRKIINVPALLYNYDTLLDLAKENNSSLTVAEQNKIVADQNVSLSRSSFFPRLALTGSYGYSDRTTSSTSERFDSDIKTTSEDGNIGLGLSYNLFNGFRNDIDLQNAIIQSDIQNLALRKIQNELEGDVKEKYDTYRKRLQFIELEEQNVTAAKQNLQLQEDRFQTGTASSLEFRDAQVNLARAQNALIVARYQARITLLEIQQLIGELRIE